MGGAWSEDLRSRVLKVGRGHVGSAARFGVRVSSAIRSIARAKIGELAPRPHQCWDRGRPACGDMGLSGIPCGRAVEHYGIF